MVPVTYFSESQGPPNLAQLVSGVDGAPAPRENPKEREKSLASRPFNRPSTWISMTSTHLAGLLAEQVEKGEEWAGLLREEAKKGAQLQVKRF